MHALSCETLFLQRERFAKRCPCPLPPVPRNPSQADLELVSHLAFAA